MFSPSSEVANVLVELLTSSPKPLCSSQPPFYFCVTHLICVRVYSLLFLTISLLAEDDPLS